jgi:hypothetical protein
MAYFFPEGSAIYFSQTFASEKTISVLTNANPAVATSTSHGYTDGDEILLTSGWEDATDSVYVVDVSDANTFAITGLNATNTNFYPSGAGTGTAEKISSWVSIPQILTVNSSGGDPRYTTISQLSKRNSQNIPTGFNATNLTFGIGWDPSNANFQTMQDVAKSHTMVAVKMVVGGGGTVYGYGYLDLSEVPSMSQNQVLTVQCAISIQGRMVGYS